MENYHELVSSTKVILDGSNYGLWKSRMRSIILGIDAMAWKSVTTGWSEPKAKDENGVESNKEEELWTETELKMAKFNSRALSAIHASVTKKHFELIQGCETAKEALEILQTHFEGTSKVKSSRLDYLASKFENLKMGESESVEEFSSHLSDIAQESLVLGNKYKDKKLVKKFLRCLPSKYTTYKAAMSVSLNTYEISFDEVVGMLRAHEMEIGRGKKGKGVALVSQDSDDKENDDDPVSMLVSDLTESFVESNQVREEEVHHNVLQKCHECKGYGHYKTDCPTVRRREIKFYKYKGIGQTQLERVNDQKRRREKSMIGIDEIDSEEDSDEEELANFVAFIGITEFVEGETDTDDDQSSADGDDGIIYQELCQTVVQIGKENLCLKKEKSWLEDTVINLKKKLDDKRKKEANTSDLKKENVRLAVHIELLEKQVKNEKARSSDLNAKLEHHYKTTSRGLGYTGYGKSDTEPIKFVPSLNSTGRTTTESTTSKTGAEKVKNLQKVGRSEIQQEKGCYYCGKPGHIKKKCYHFREKVNQLLRQGKYWWNGSRNQVWIRKSDLGRATVKPTQRSIHGGPRCSMALVSEAITLISKDENPWCFDTGCSRHMTGTRKNLREIKPLKGGRVTFGDGSQGAIKGKGKTVETKPPLKDVFIVKGLKSNIISISQLCDEGLVVHFTRRECKAVNEENIVILHGIAMYGRVYNSALLHMMKRVCGIKDLVT
ncbi:uncharacterized protein LOC106404430 [Brassica napus]|uniref:uncharacterized protein LOC106404430 n=1 Tax=Brassica napus TaxID=3708 RepID=UPI002079F6DB|nr:uncharacterized protein LOC106404430 [Brassica napus]